MGPTTWLPGSPHPSSLGLRLQDPSRVLAPKICSRPNTNTATTCQVACSMSGATPPQPASEQMPYLMLLGALTPNESSWKRRHGHDLTDVMSGADVPALLELSAHESLSLRSETMLLFHQSISSSMCLSVPGLSSIFRTAFLLHFPVRFLACPSQQVFTGIITVSSASFYLYLTFLKP